MNNGAAPIAEPHTILRTTGSSPDQICLLGPLRETTAAPGDVRRADLSNWPAAQMAGVHDADRNWSADIVAERALPDSP